MGTTRSESRCVATAAIPSDDDLPVEHAVVWIADPSMIAKAREALAALRHSVPTAKEVVLDAGTHVVSFGTLDLNTLAEADEELANDVQMDLHGEVEDAGDQIARLLEEVKEDPGSAKIHVQDDGFYVTAEFWGGEAVAKTVVIPFR